MDPIVISALTLTVVFKEEANQETGNWSVGAYVGTQAWPPTGLTVLLIEKDAIPYVHTYMVRAINHDSTFTLPYFPWRSPMFQVGCRLSGFRYASWR